MNNKNDFWIESARAHAQGTFIGFLLVVLFLAAYGVYRLWQWIVG